MNLLAHNAPLPDLVAVLTDMADEQVPGTRCSIHLHNGVLPDSSPNDGQGVWHQAVKSSLGETIGSVVLSHPDSSPTREPRALLDAIARLTALAYDRQVLPAELRERSRLAALAVRISGIQSRTLPLQTMLQLCTEALVEDLKMAFARIWLLNEGEQTLILAASAGLSTNLHGAYSRVPVATSLKIGRMVQDRQPMLTNSILEEPWIKEPDWAKREGLVAYAGYPLIADDHVVGVIAMFARHPLHPHTLQALGAIAGGIAQAIIRARTEDQRLQQFKELQALHGTASLLQADEAIPQLLQKAVSLVPAAWQYPEITAARIEFGGQVHQTTGFRRTPWHQATEFRLASGQRGSLEVVYLEERPEKEEGPFLREERRLLDSLAEMLRNYLERTDAEQALRESRDLLCRLNATLEDLVKERTQQLVAKQEQLRSLAIALSRTEERARRQLATDLHDNLAQLLALAKMKLLRAKEPLKVLDEVRGLLDESLTYTRTVMADLRPPLLSDAHDLQRAISWVVARVERHGLRVTVQADSVPVVLHEEVLTVTYQAIHELLFNVLKHAQTLDATLTLRRDQDNLEAVVTDQGIGFDPDRRTPAATEGGFGLLNIRERVELLGGRLTIASRPGEGTRSTLIIPVTDPSGRPLPSPSLMSERTERQRPATSDHAASLTRIVLVDDHQMVREGLRTIIEEHAALRVVAEASDGQMAIDVVRQWRPDVILMDVNMPKMNGLEATRRIVAEFPEITVIGVSMHDDDQMALAMKTAGAADYVSKGEAAEKLVGVIGGAKSARRYSET